MRVLLEEGPRFPEGVTSRFALGDWPGRWVICPDCQDVPFVAAYRLKFELSKAARLRCHVSADQRYELFLDGQGIGRGPERGDFLHWFYESYELELTAGLHVLVARHWALDPQGHQPPLAQLSYRPAFLLVAEPPYTDLLSTGRAPWQAKKLTGYSFYPSNMPYAGRFAGGTIGLDGRQFPWGWEKGEGTGWQDVLVLEAARDRIHRTGELDHVRLRPAMLPAMLEEPRAVGKVRHVEEPAGPETNDTVVDPARHLAGEEETWQALCQGRGTCAVPPRTRRRVLIDLENYFCAYPQITVSGGRGARIRLLWAESLYRAEPGSVHKDHRDQIAGKRFFGRGDWFVCDGGRGRVFETLWWCAGRYVELLVETAEEPLTVERLIFRETRYPLEMEAAVELSEPRFNAAVPVMWRTLQVCSHETYMDCPYYEQLMYTGDTRLEALVTLLCSSDDRLPRKALAMFDASRLHNGLTQARYPSSLPQIIPQFSLFWVGMVYDFALWRGEREAVARYLPGVRQVLEAFIGRIGEDGLVRWPEGWNWVDWVPSWPHGEAPDDGSGLSGINHWQLVMMLGLAEQLERWIGDVELARRYARLRKSLARRSVEVFWDARRGLMADTPSKNSFSEHAQCYALLSGILDTARQRRVVANLVKEDADLARATVYFQHYLFEVFRLHGRIDAMLQRLSLWYELVDRGLRTVIEQPEPSRSDCHAWGAHPIYHALASILGIRPAGLGFEQVEIRPQLGSLNWAKGTLIHPRGRISLEIERQGHKLRVHVVLPEGLDGWMIVGRSEQRLRSGQQTLTVTL